MSFLPASLNIQVAAQRGGTVERISQIPVIDRARESPKAEDCGNFDLFWKASSHIVCFEAKGAEQPVTRRASEWRK